MKRPPVTLPRTAVAVWCAIVLVPAAARAQSPAALTLGDAVRAAATNAAGPQVARIRAEQADARVRQRRGEFLPTLSIAALDNERTFNSAGLGIGFTLPGSGQSLFNPAGERLGPVRTWDVRGVLRQNLLDPASFARLRAARASAAAAVADATGAEHAAAAVAAAAYVRALRSRAQLGARLSDSTLAAELLGMARDQLATGTGNGLDVTRARSQLSLMRSQLIAARSERDRASIELARALGVPPDTQIALADSLPTLASFGPVPAEVDAIATATASRADLLTVAAQMRSADRQVGAIRAERLPALSLYADQGSTGKTTDRLLSTYTWGIQLSVPVFDGFRRESRIAEARAVTSELDVRRRDLIAQVTAEVQSALVELRAAREQLDAAAERLVLAGQELGFARDRFRAGVAGNADVVTAALAVNAARTHEIDARAALQAAQIALLRAEGVLTGVR